jgi:hypothetical protein
MNCEKMNIKDYGRIIDSDQILILLETIDRVKKEQPDNYYSNNWFYYNSSPKNNIESYIRENFNTYFSHINVNQVCGFEWWVHDEETIETVSLHFDCDEYLRVTEKQIVAPLSSTVTYLNDNLSPTIITDIETTDGLNYNPKYPSEITYSFPGEGKFIIFDPKYLHGVAKNSSKRTTLLYNIWEYRPEELTELKFIEDLFLFNIHKNEARDLRVYNDMCNYIPQKIFGNEVPFKFPKTFINYETYCLKC